MIEPGGLQNEVLKADFATAPIPSWGRRLKPNDMVRRYFLSSATVIAYAAPQAKLARLDGPVPPCEPVG